MMQIFSYGNNNTPFGETIENFGEKDQPLVIRAILRE